MADIVYLDSLADRAVLKGASCAFGVFDGVHKGHRFLIDKACKSAEMASCKAVVLTFDIDPDELFHPERLHKLLTNDERLEALRQTGVDAVAVLRFTRAFAALPPENFLARTFDAGVPHFIHVGCDIRFGRRAVGTVDTLAKWGRCNGVDVVSHDLVLAEGKPITATRIRMLLEAGDEPSAHELLGY